MKNESNKKENENEKKDDTFVYAAFLVVSLIVGTIIVILKLFGVF